MFLAEAIISHVKYIHLALDGNAFISKLYTWVGFQYRIQPPSVSISH
jgi:hypothetical protein